MQLATLFNAGRIADTEIQARALLERYVDNGFVWKALAASLMAQNKDALDALQKAAKLMPDDAEAHTNLGNALRLSLIHIYMCIRDRFSSAPHQKSTT